MARRLALIPGMRILARGSGQVQIGLNPGTRTVLDHTGPTRRTLAALERGETPPSDPAARSVLRKLAPLLVDGDQLAPAGVDPGDAAAAAAAEPRRFPAALAARRRSRVRIHNDLPTAPGRLLRSAGVGLWEPGGEPPDAVLLLSIGEPDRGLLDPLIRDGIPHALVRAIEAEIVIGPLVVPGQTACLRCLDAHHGADDPLYPVLASSHCRATRHDGVAEPVDSALAALGTAWAVRDLVSQLEGGHPSTWSATVTVGPDLGSLRAIGWVPHPGCSCAWAPGVDRSATMAP